MEEDDFFIAIQEGEAGTVRAALAAQPMLARTRNAEGLSALTIAAYWGRRDLVEMLIELCGPLGLWEAAIVGATKRVEDLIGADPSLVTRHSVDGFTGLHLAVFFGNEETARFLIDSGADVAARTTNALNNQPLHAAVVGADPSGRLACASLLLTAGADPNATQSGDFTPLMAAAESGDTDLVDLLTSHGASTEPLDEQGRSAAAHAEQAGHSELAERLRSEPQ